MKCCKYGKYIALRSKFGIKFAYFVYVCITRGNCYHFWAENGNNFCAY
jgi:hypothetical protein